MRYIKPFLTLWLPVLVWMGIIFYFSSRQRISVSETWTLNFIFFKSLHLIEYGFLFFLSHRALKYSTGLEERYIFIGSFLLVLIYAISDELHQTLTPTREGTVRDVIIDCLGAGITWILLKHIEHILPGKLRNLLERWQLI